MQFNKEKSYLLVDLPHELPHPQLLLSLHNHLGINFNNGFIMALLCLLVYATINKIIMSSHRFGIHASVLLQVIEPMFRIFITENWVYLVCHNLSKVMQLISKVRIRWEIYLNVTIHEVRVISNDDEFLIGTLIIFQR